MWYNSNTDVYFSWKYLYNFRHQGGGFTMNVFIFLGCALTIVRDFAKANAITHSGRFHPDDIFSSLIVLLLSGNVRLARVPEINKEMISKPKPPIIFDIGGGSFDHHQSNAPIRSNGVRYASFGLLWKSYGVRILKERYNCSHSDAVIIADMLDKSFVQAIDYEDNKKDKIPTVQVPTLGLSSVIASFYPTWDNVSPEAEEEAFVRALEIAAVAFNSAILQSIAKLHSKEIVEKAIAESKEHILVLPQYVPWKDWLLESTNPKAKDILYVIFPSSRIKGYDIMSVPKRIGSKFLRKPFPDAWAGLQGIALAQKINVPLAYFCHLERYMASACSLEAAKSMAELAMVS